MGDPSRSSQRRKAGVGGPAVMQHASFWLKTCVKQSDAHHDILPKISTGVDLHQLLCHVILSRHCFTLLFHTAVQIFTYNAVA